MVQIPSLLRTRISRTLQGYCASRSSWPDVALALVVALLLGLSSCGGDARQTETPTAPPTPRPTSQPPQATAVAPRSSTTPGLSQITLRVWVPPEFEIGADSAFAGDLFGAFEQAYPGIQIDVSTKRAYGKGGIVDLLTRASEVAPGYLPDLILVDGAELARAASASPFAPIENLLSTPAQDMAFPNLLAAGISGGDRVGIPFAMDFLHLAYRTSITLTDPLDWSAVTASGGRYIFAAGRSDGYSSDSILIQCLGVDGSLVDDQGKPALDSRLLTRVLDTYRQMSDQDALSPDALRLDSPLEAWLLYGSGGADFAEVRASQFIADAPSMPDTGFAAIPTRNGRVATLAHLWLWAIPARMPERQQAAASFLEWVLEPSRQRAWCQAAGLLPSRPEAWSPNGLSAEYSLFLFTLAEEALAFPPSMQSAGVSAALQQALSQVLSGSVAPKQAAEQAVNIVKSQ